MDTVKTLPLSPVVTTHSIHPQPYPLSSKRSRKENGNSKSSSKGKKPLDHQDAKTPREEDVNIKSSSKAKQPLDNQDAKRFRKEYANCKSSSKAKRPLGNQDVKTSREEDANFKSSSKAKWPLDNQDTEEVEYSSDSYSKGQTGLIEVIPKPSDPHEHLRRNFFVQMAKVYAEVRAEANSPLGIEKRKEARKRVEEIKQMTPEQHKEYKLSLFREIIAHSGKPTWW